MSDKLPAATRKMNQQIQDAINTFVVSTSEFTSSIQICATKLEANGSTTRFYSGSGDLMARQGSCNEFILGFEE